MALSTLSTAALLACAFILYRITTNYFARRRFREFAKQNGCEEPPDATPPFPGGWRTLWRLVYANTSSTGSTTRIMQAFTHYVYVQTFEENRRRRSGRHHRGGLC
jgi:hypothetical protein